MFASDPAQHATPKMQASDLAHMVLHIALIVINISNISVDAD